MNKNPSLRTLAAARLLRASLELHELDEEHIIHCKKKQLQHRSTEQVVQSKEPVANYSRWRTESQEIGVLRLKTQYRQLCTISKVIHHYFKLTWLNELYYANTITSLTEKTPCRFFYRQQKTLPYSHLNLPTWAEEGLERVCPPSDPVLFRC